MRRVTSAPAIPNVLPQTTWAIRLVGDVKGVALHSVEFRWANAVP
jgi:hypothetical protein